MFVKTGKSFALQTDLKSNKARGGGAGKLKLQTVFQSIGWLVVLGLAALGDSISVYIGPLVGWLVVLGLTAL